MYFAVPRANDKWWLFPRLTSKPIRQIVVPHEAEQTDKRRRILTKYHWAPAHNRQTNTGSPTPFVAGMEALEYPKNVFVVTLGNADAVVANVIHDW